MPAVQSSSRHERSLAQEITGTQAQLLVILLKNRQNIDLEMRL